MGVPPAWSPVRDGSVTRFGVGCRSPRPEEVRDPLHLVRPGMLRLGGRQQHRHRQERGVLHRPLRPRDQRGPGAGRAAVRAVQEGRAPGMGRVSPPRRAQGGRSALDVPVVRVGARHRSCGGESRLARRHHDARTDGRRQRVDGRRRHRSDRCGHRTHVSRNRTADDRGQRTRDPAVERAPHPRPRRSEGVLHRAVRVGRQGERVPGRRVSGTEGRGHLPGRRTGHPR